MEFHISRDARELYDFDQTLFTLTGNVIFVNFRAARVFVQKMNQKRDLIRYPERAVKAGQVNAMGLIDEILHYIVQLYRKQKNARVMDEALAWLADTVGEDRVDATLKLFLENFPPIVVYRQEMSADAYLEGQTDGVPNRQIVLEELILLWLANENPGFSAFVELFDDTELERETAYRDIVSELHNFFDKQPRFGPNDENLIDMLSAPARRSPHSLSGQLEFMRENWGSLLGRYLFRLLSSLDLIAEEEKAILVGPGPSRVYEFREGEYERFSPDQDWMPKVVLLAKNTYVWLDQLSKKYERSITRLDQVPDEELDTLARRGFTGLWLIGLWERSSASQRIKQIMGNPEAVASAYSVDDYRVADDLGGEAGYQALRDRAWRRGIRLASDMVPNHMGIDSKWVIEQPERFISLDHSPFPSYSFTGPDLCQDGRVGIYLEDGYYDRSDAAVVFKRVDHWTGDEKYLYHGNDGTSMPWNDTAQLDFLREDVREAVINMILRVARKFPIIRFDAAMTLAKKHYQRLWFPEPGTGGAIPSRADHGLIQEQFDKLFPKEFWRHVVDRVAEEVPDTLLLAEAFWLMEGYFVRTLGMHRVYNSAFMNMLRDEDNGKYRSVMKNTLEFDPRIMKRYVNFMNNPDERTAVDQFGKRDKYFGICTMLATMPGLPMFGHGQIEGYTEKYGMEYRRAYWGETPDEDLVNRHERQIFPLLHRRSLFSGVEDFLLYDFFTPEGYVNEDVFAYSNRTGEERALVLYHNRYAETRGWVRASVAYAVKTEDESKRLVQRSLGEGLGLQDDDRMFSVFRDHMSGLEYIRSNRELHDRGLYAELGAYKCHVFMDFRQVRDSAAHPYAQLNSYLQGRGVPSIEEALKEVLLQPMHGPFRQLVNADVFRRLMMAAEPVSEREKIKAELAREVEERMLRLLEEVRSLTDGAVQGEAVAKTTRRELQVVWELPRIGSRLSLHGSVVNYLNNGPPGVPDVGLNDNPKTWATLLGWLFSHGLGRAAAGPASTESPAAFAETSRSWLDEWLLGKMIVSAMQDLGIDQESAWWAVTTIKVLTSHQRWFERDERTDPAYHVLRRWLADNEVQRLLRVNRYQGVLWFNEEAFKQVLWWMMIVATVAIAADGREAAAERIAQCYCVIEELQRAGEASGYQLENLLEASRA
jgi:glycosidase